MHHQWCPAKSHDSSFLIIFVPLHSYLCLVMVCLYSYARPDMPGYLHWWMTNGKSRVSTPEFTLEDTEGKPIYKEKLINQYNFHISYIYQYNKEYNSISKPSAYGYGLTTNIWIDVYIYTEKKIMLTYMLPWIFEVPSQSGSKHISYTHTHIYISSMLAVSYHIQSLSDFLYMKNILQPLLCKFLPTCNDWKGASAKLIFDVLIKRTLLPRVKASLYLFFNCPFACSSVYSIAIFIYPSRHARVPR